MRALFSVLSSFSGGPGCPSPLVLFRAGFFLWLWLCSAVSGGGGTAFGMGEKSGQYGVGMQTFGVWETTEGGRFDFVVFFPGLSRGREIVREEWRLRAAEGARPLPGLYPVVLLSHDTAGSRFANSDVATALAGSGFIVIAPTHAGDNQNNSDGLHTADLLFTRPRQLLLALETVLASPVFAPYADESRIGLLGVGFGCVTALQLAGLRPDFGRMADFCAEAGESSPSSTDPFCTPWARSRLARLPGETAAREAGWGDRAYIPPLDLYAPSLAPVAPAQSPREAPPALSSWDRLTAFFAFSAAPGISLALKAPAAEPSSNATLPILVPDFDGGPLFGEGDSHRPYAYLALPGPRHAAAEEEPVPEAPPSLPAAGPVVHRRPASVRHVRALALLLPAGGTFFPRGGLTGIPALAIEAGEDGVYAPERHSRPYLALLPPRTRVLTLEGADHFSLFAPCSEEIRENLASACGRMVEKERAEARTRRDQELISFFRSSLGLPRDPAPPSGLMAADRPAGEGENPPSPRKSGDRDASPAASPRR